jgi:hypothetical protein
LCRYTVSSGITNRRTFSHSLARRDDVLRTVGEPVVRTQTSGRGRYAVDEQFITVYAGTTT